MNILLTQNQKTIVDEFLYNWLNQWLWYYNTPYACRVNDISVKIYMHKEIFQLYHPSYIGEVDHENRKTLDNRYENLRSASDTQQGANQNIRVDNTSNFRGVFWSKELNKWVAQITHENNQIYLGVFNKIIEAAKEYDKAAIYYHKEFANLNFKTLMYEYIIDPYSPKLKGHTKGEESNLSSITEKIVLYILNEHYKGKSRKELAIENNLSRQQVDNIINRKNWRHVKWNPFN